MQDRFKLILEEKGLSAQKTASIIGIDASAVSHLLNGRRRPSFEVLDKIGQAFPDINLNWLISGKGEMYNHNGAVRQESRQPSGKLLFETEKQPALEQSTIQQPKELPVITNLPVTQEKATGKKIKRIILFFEDGSFEDYAQ